MVGFRKVRYREVAKAIGKVGYTLERSRGSHFIYNDERNKPVTLVMKDPSEMVSRVVWSGLKSQLGDKFAPFESKL